MPTNNPSGYAPTADMKKADNEALDKAHEEEQNKKEAREKAAADLNATIKEKEETLKRTLDMMAEKFKSNPIYTTYIQFKVNNLVVCNTSKDSEQNIIMSLEVRNNGSGYANSFSLQICYAPSVNMFSADGWDPNKLEENLLAASYNSKDFSSRYCTLKYGYGDDEDLRTKEFLGIVIDYTCDIQDGMLIYDITGYSSIAALNESKEPISIKLSSDEQINGIEPTLAVERIVKTYLQQSSGTQTVVDGEGNKVTLESTPVSSTVNYDIKFIGDTLCSDAKATIATQLDKNVSQAITDILNKAVYKPDAEVTEDNKNINILNKSKYGWFIDDTTSADGNYQGTIYVYRLSPDDNKSADVSIVFNWMAPGNEGLDHIVKSFRPEFNGKVLFALASQKFNPTENPKIKEENGATDNPSGYAPTADLRISEYSSDSIPKKSEESEDSPENVYKMLTGSYYLSNDGKICATEKSISPPIGGTAQAAMNSIEQEKATWLEDVQYCYKATLITMGVPCPIPIIGKIRVVPLIYTKPHHSEGIYLVNGTTDQITSNGFFTTWNLMKYMDPGKVENPDITETDEDTDEQSKPNQQKHGGRGGSF